MCHRFWPHAFFHLFVGTFMLFAALPLLAHANPPSPRTAAYGLIRYSGGIVSDRAGVAGIIATDLTNDGQMEVLSCGTSAPYAIRATGDLEHQTTWYGERLGCTAIASSDRNGDAIQEIYVGSASGSVHVHTWDGMQYHRTQDVNLPGGAAVNALEVANVDGDSALEIVVVQDSATLIYDATTLGLEWNVTFGGDDVGVGNVDANGDVEVVVNGPGYAYILRPATQTVVATQAGGFGDRIAVGDTDNDGMSEIAYYGAGRLVVWDADTGIAKWDISAPEASAISIEETNASTPGREVLIGTDSYLGYVHGHNGVTGGHLWTITHTGFGTYGLDAADTDDDGVVEVWFGVGLREGWDDSIVAGDPTTGQMEFVGLDQDAPMLVAAGDVDHDGDTELLGATYGTHTERYGADILVYDSTDYIEERRISTYVYSSEAGVGAYQVEVGQLDADGPLEVVAAGHRYGSGAAQVRVYDGATGAEQIRYSPPSSAVRTLHIENIDADPVNELMFGAADNRLWIYNGATNSLEWQSPVLDSVIRDIAVGDTNGDGAPELALLTEQSLYLYTVGTWNLNRQIRANDGGFNPIAVGIHTGEGTTDIIIASVNDPSPSSTRLQLFNYTSIAPLWQETVNNAVANDMIVGDVDDDGTGEIILGGSQLGASGAESVSLLWVASYDSMGLTVEYSDGRLWGDIQHLDLADMDGDETVELLFASQDILQVRALDPQVPTAVDLGEMALGAHNAPISVAGASIFFGLASLATILGFRSIRQG